MDFVIGMLSLVKDVSKVDKEFRNLNLQLKYVLDKSTRIEPKIDPNCAEMAFRAEIFNIKTNECKHLSIKLDELLNAPTIAMKDKVRLSLPFNQTKNEITKSIEELDKIINDIKEDLSEETKVEIKDGGVKRAMNELNEMPIDPSKNGNHLSIQEIDEQIEELYDMGPTIQEEDAPFSQSNRKEQQEMSFEITLHSSPEILEVIKNEKEDLLKISKKVTHRELKEDQEIKLYTVARINFQKCHSKIRALNKDIDGISTNGHFHFVLRKIGENLENENTKLVSDHKKGNKGRLCGTQKPEEEVFFSFPTDERATMNEEFALIAKKETSSKTLYRMCGENWNKVDEDEIQILNGDKLAAFVNPNKKEPAIYYEIAYEFNH